VAHARSIQRERARELALSSQLNAALSPSDLQKVVELDLKARRLLETAMNQLGLSARAYTKILRVARSIADLEREARVRTPHVAEAIQGRLLDREVGR
jgi:magnesium chelatase family protein